MSFYVTLGDEVLAIVQGDHFGKHPFVAME